MLQTFITLWTLARLILCAWRLTLADWLDRSEMAGFLSQYSHVRFPCGSESNFMKEGTGLIIRIMEHKLTILRQTKSLARHM